MVVSAELLRSHINYMAWASRLLVEAAAGLSKEELNHDFGTADKSVLGTLVHIFAADRVWLARMNGETPRIFLTKADHALAVLEKDWPALHERWKGWADQQTDATAAAELSYADMSGNSWRQPVGHLVLHVVNHGTHHRGQVSGFLRTMGHVPPKLDLVNYYRMGQTV